MEYTISALSLPMLITNQNIINTLKSSGQKVKKSVSNEASFLYAFILRQSYVMREEWTYPLGNLIPQYNDSP